MTKSTICDFYRSFVTMRLDTLTDSPKTVSHKPPFTLNNCRWPVVCRTLIHDNQTDNTHSFVLSANCKTERVGVDKDIWTEPNADVTALLSDKEIMILKSWDHCGRRVMLYPESLGEQPRRQIETLDEAFDSTRIDIKTVEAEMLETVDEVVGAVLDNSPLLSQTKIRQGRYVAIIEYVVNVINASERDKFYQVDTGPVMFPDLSREPEQLLAGMELAFIAHNGSDWAEFIVGEPTKINDTVSVYHYSRPVRLKTTNTVFRYPF